MSRRLAGLELAHPLMNGAGVCKTLEQVTDLARSGVAAVVVGSITVAPRAGNPGQVYWECEDYSINSLGLPNPGIGYYSEALPHMVRIAHEHQKPLIVSVAGSDPDEYVELTEVAIRRGVDLVELNLGCPNVWDGGQQKRIPCFDPNYTGRLCSRVGERLRAAATERGWAGAFGLKLSPFSDPAALRELAETLTRTARETPEFRFVTATNAFPNALAIDENGRARIDMQLGGLGGRAMKPIALGQVKQLRELLPAEIDLIGIGGVSSGRDVADYLDVGATCVQATTIFNGTRRGADLVSEVLSEYVDLSSEELTI